MNVIKCINCSFPIGTNLMKNFSSALVLSSKMKIDILGICEKNQLLGIIIFDDNVWEINREEFNTYFNIHRIPNKDMKKLWPRTNKFYLYKTKNIFSLRTEKVNIKFDNRLFYELDLSDSESEKLSNMAKIV